VKFLNRAVKKLQKGKSSSFMFLTFLCIVFLIIVVFV